MGAGCLLDVGWVKSVSPSPAYWSYLHPDLMRAEMKSQYRSDCLMEMERCGDLPSGKREYGNQRISNKIFKGNIFRDTLDVHTAHP